MRVNTAAVTAAAALLFLPCYSASESSSLLYLLPQKAASSAVTTLGTSQAQVAISHWLRLDAWDASPLHIQSRGEDGGDCLHGFGPISVDELFSTKPKAAIILALESSSSEDFLLPSLAPSYSIPTSSFKWISTLLSTYASRAKQLQISTYTTQSSASSRTSGILDIFALTPSESTTQFMAEFGSLASYIDDLDSYTKPSFGAFSVKGLEKIRAEHGTSSEVYQTASFAIRAVLSQLVLRKQRVALLVTPPSAHVARRQPQQPLPPSMPTDPTLDSSATCWANATLCDNATNACSGRGSCIPATRVGRPCFACICNGTTDGQTWVGARCERLDVSGPFALLVGTAATVLIVLIASVSLLYGVGNEELPGTLASTGAAGAKRE